MLFEGRQPLGGMFGVLPGWLVFNMHPKRRLPERRDGLPRPAPLLPGILPRLDLLADRRRGIPRVGERDLGGGAETEVTPPAVRLDPQDPLAGAVLADDQHQALP